jgi:hypothetical protein
MPLMAHPMTSAAATRTSCMRQLRPWRSRTNSHSATNEAAIATPIEASSGRGSYSSPGWMVIDVIPT